MYRRRPMDDGRGLCGINILLGELGAVDVDCGCGGGGGEIG